MIRENFFFGAGYGSFTARYMDFQGDFFRTNPTSSYVLYASTVKYPFNETLKFWSENGLAGIIVIILLAKSAFAVLNTNRLMICAKASIIAVLVFSCFSYPLAILPIKILLVLSISIIAGYQNHIGEINITNIQKSKYFKISVVGLGAILGFFNLVYVHSYQKSFVGWLEANKQYRMGNYQLAANNYENVYSSQADNPEFLLQYGKTLAMLGSNDEAIKILNAAMYKQNTPLTQITLGECYQELRKYSLAEKAYLDAYFMVPKKIYPQYLLVKLYLLRGQRKKALELANKLINLKPTVDSEASIEMKQNLRNMF